MARSYKEAATGRMSRLSPAGQHQRKVFAESYDVAMQLMALREKRGLTQVELAKATGIAQSEICRIERGVANPTEKTILRLADALQADLVIAEREASLTGSVASAPVVRPG